MSGSGLHRLGWVVVLAGLCGLGGCVFPEEAGRYDNTCEAPRFDLGSGTDFCSGSWSSTPVVQLADLFDESEQRPAQVYVPESDLLVTAQGVDEGLRVLGFREATQAQPINVYADTLRGVPSGQVTATTFARLRWSAASGLRGAVVAALDYRDVVVAPLGRGASADVVGFEVLSAALGVEGCGRAVPASSRADAAPEAPRAEVEVRDLAAFSFPEDAERVYVAAALGCGVVILASEGGAIQPVLIYRGAADGLALDEAQQVLYVAGGEDGLARVSLEAVRGALEAGFDDGASDQSAAFTRLDVGVSAAHHVTQVRVDAGRVVYVSQATTEGDPVRGASWFASGYDRGGEALEERVALPLSAQDLTHDAARWEIAWLGGDLYGALFNAWNGEAGRISFVSLVRGVSDERAYVLTSLPTAAPVESVQSIEGALYALQRDLIYRFEVEVE